MTISNETENIQEVTLLSKINKSRLSSGIIKVFAVY